ncbi:TNF receptor-associated factor 4 [Oopsacas minuta]|uniref:TNF receptor-associated factor 4 n=1 Tax=Oopsacas minuta TaxID=111878 RepID=A0AAV7JFK7_9METZ|nr:TNF receptor-associated factor 4 [Oopsacas minuta]
MLVELKDSIYGGYKQELLNDNLDPLATKFILCTGCNGLSREACSVGEDQNIMCLTCIPKDATHIPMKQARESVPNIPAKCALCTRGCIWKGDMGNLTSHLDECEFFVVNCPNSCQMILQRLELEEHLKFDCTHRDVTCEHCNGTVQFKDLTKHYKECQEFPLVCQNVCAGTFKGKELQNHINTDCPNTVISCTYKPFGCNARMKRCELAVHNSNNILVHLECTKNYVEIHEKACCKKEMKAVEEKLKKHVTENKNLKNEFEKFKKEIMGKIQEK